MEMELVENTIYYNYIIYLKLTLSESKFLIDKMCGKDDIINYIKSKFISNNVSIQIIINSIE